MFPEKNQLKYHLSSKKNSLLHSIVLRQKFFLLHHLTFRPLSHVNQTLESHQLSLAGSLGSRHTEHLVGSLHTKHEISKTNGAFLSKFMYLKINLNQSFCSFVKFCLSLVEVFLGSFHSECIPAIT